jgi:hypothetical protein
MSTDHYNWAPIPERMRHGLKLYIEQGVPPGHFLSAVLSNDLREAVGRADDENVRLLPEYIRFLYNNVPQRCWGSREKFDNWVKSGGLRMHAVYLVYPEKGWVSNQKIISWYDDAVVNGKITGPYADEVADMVAALDDIGDITAGEPR